MGLLAHNQALAHLSWEFRRFNFMSPWEDILHLRGDEKAAEEEGEA